jgi:hypothetical protein
MVRTWGDVRSGIWTSLARYALLNLERAPTEHARNWRPNIMVFTGQPHNREHLVALAEWLSLGRGIVTFSQLITGAVDQGNKPKLRETARRHIRSYIKDRRMAAFAEAQIVPDFARGAVSVAQAHGIGQLESNAVMMGWSGTPKGRALLMEVLRNMTDLQKSVIFLNVDPEQGFGKRRVIHVWWGGRGGNADLMLLLAHLIREHRVWDRAELRVLRIVDHKEGVEQTQAATEVLLAEVRVEATVRIIVRKDPTRPIADLLAEHSVEADLTFLGMQRPDAGASDAYGERLQTLAQAVGSVVMVCNGQPQGALLQGE